MTDPSGRWKRKQLFTVQSDHGPGLYATQDISRGTTILIEYPERVIQAEDYHGLPTNVVFGSGLSTFDDFLMSREKVIHGKNPTLLYLFPPDEVVETPGTLGGEIILVTPSLVNHSCAPNMLRIDSTSLETRRLECRFITTRNINIGDQLTTLYEPKVFKWELPHTRRALLSDVYGFFCRCRKCISQSGSRDLIPLAPATAERVRQLQVYAEEDSEQSTLPFINKKHMVSRENITVPGDSAGSDTIPLQSIGNSATVNKPPHKERFASWLGTASTRTKTWLKNVPGEAKKALEENKIPFEEPGPSKSSPGPSKSGPGPSKSER